MSPSFQVIQVYISWNSTGERMPRLQLVSFDRVFIPVGESHTFRFTISEEQLAVWTESGWEVQNGKCQASVAQCGIQDLRTGSCWFDPLLGQYSLQSIVVSHCNGICSSLTNVCSFDDGYTGKQPEAWKE